MRISKANGKCSLTKSKKKFDFIRFEFEIETIQAEKKTKNRRKIAQMVCSRIAIDLNLDLIRRAVRRLDFDVTRWKLGMITNIFTGTFCMMPTIISYSLTLIIYNQYYCSAQYSHVDIS